MKPTKPDQFTVKVPSRTVLYQWDRAFKGEQPAVAEFLRGIGGAAAIRGDFARVYRGNARMGITELKTRGLVSQ